jgi:hypothetical protein
MWHEMAESPVAIHASSPAELKERIDAERRGTPFLVYRDGGGNQRLVDLASQPARLTIGRRPSNDIALTWDFGVSRVHAVLERIGDAWTMVDDGISRHGTYVNGARRTGRHRLAGGDVLRVGGTAILFCAPRPDSSVTGADEHVPAAALPSEAQRRVLIALCRPHMESGGYAAPPSNHDIAAELFLSVDAVKTHLRALFQLFDVADLPQNQKRARLVERALNTGVVTQRDL